MECLEREILELPLERVDAEAVARGHTSSVRALSGLVLLAEILTCVLWRRSASLMRMTRTSRHRDDHLAVVLGLGFSRFWKLIRQLRDPFDEQKDVRLNSTELEIESVSHDVVQEGGGDRLLVEVEVRADARNPERMVDEVLAGASRLPRVCPLPCWSSWMSSAGWCCRWAAGEGRRWKPGSAAATGLTVIRCCR
jgi:hypothetical protein